jgi:histone H3/H4
MPADASTTTPGAQAAVQPLTHVRAQDIAGLTERERLALERQLEEGCGLRAAFRHTGLAEDQIGQAVRRLKSKPYYQRSVADHLRDSMSEHAPALLTHALHLAMHAKSQFVQQQMVTWLLERSGMGTPSAPQSPQGGVAVTLNILAHEAPGVETRGSPLSEGIRPHFSRLSTLSERVASALRGPDDRPEEDDGA